MGDNYEVRIDADGGIHVIAVDADGRDTFEVECVGADDEWAPRE